MAEKWYPFEEALRVPLVIQDPRMSKSVRGTVEDALTLNIDLTPTILRAAGLKPSPFMQGRDMAPLYLDRRNDVNDKDNDVVVSRKKRRAASSTTAKDDWRKEWFYEFNMGTDIENATDHQFKHFIDASFAVITKEWKYVYWPVQNFEQLYHRSLDKYDEWDMLHTELNNETNPAEVETIQTTDQIYNDMKERYARLKKRAQSGKKV